MNAVEESVRIGVQHAIPLFGSHHGKEIVVVDSGVVDEYIGRAVAEISEECFLCGFAVGDIKSEGVKGASESRDFLFQFLKAFRIGAAGSDDVESVMSESFCDCLAYAARSSDNQCCLHFQESCFNFSCNPGSA